MNAPLRDFLNCKEDGTENYTFKEVRESNEWIEFPTEKAACHQNFYQECIFKNGVKIQKYNAKFVDTKGREVVFNAKHEIILSYPDKGTFNYQNPDKSLLSKDSMVHNKFDITPYYNYMKELAETEQRQNSTERKLADYNNVIIYNLLVTDLCDKLVSDGLKYHYKNLVETVKSGSEWEKLTQNEQKAFDLILNQISKDFKNLQEREKGIKNSSVWEVLDAYNK